MKDKRTLNQLANENGSQSQKSVKSMNIYTYERFRKFKLFSFFFCSIPVACGSSQARD